MKHPEEVEIRRLIVHVLDNQTDPPQPVFSDDECEVDEHINGFFATHIQKALAEENAKIAKFSRPDGAANRLCQAIFGRTTSFARNSKRLAELLFAPMRQTRAISPGDMVVCLYAARNFPGQFLGIFKMDLSEAFTHRIQMRQGRVAIQIAAQENVLPNPTQKLQKCVFIRPPCNDYEMVILDNQIARLLDTSGVANFFCKTFLECELWQTDREKTRLFRSLTTKWVQDHYHELEPAQSEVISAAARQAILSDSVNVREFGRVTIPDPRLRGDYEAYLHDHNLHDVEFSPDRQYAEQATRKRKYKGDGSIVLSGDADQFDELVKVDWNRDAQNRITVVIKTTLWTEQTR
jgi:hypothetical protein